jgi:hypothetical protein
VKPASGRYGTWAGNERGKAEDKTKCVEIVFGDSWIPYQCTRKRGYGPDGEYCKQHAKKISNAL